MRQIKCLFIFTFLILFIEIGNIKAQDELNQPNLRFYLSQDKSSYAGMVIVNQIWTRYNWNNPDASGDYPSNDFDVTLRRSRLIFYTQLMDKVFIYTQIGTDGLGINNSGNPNLNLFNAQTEYILLKDKLHLGFGLSTWNGISRYNNSKLLEFLLIDNPGFAYPTGGTFDRFGRQLGVYAKGSVSKLHYRLAIARPFISTPISNSVTSVMERNNQKLAWKGYFAWQFMDRENHTFPYMTMNNLGRSRIVNLGVGFYFQPEAMENINIMAENEEFYNVFLFSTDLFIDLPVGNKQAVTAYLGYFNYNFGPEYIRSMSKMNIGTMESGNELPQGHGISEWEIGTGQIFHGELGYLLPVEFKECNLQPYAAVTGKNFEALDQSSVQVSIGTNILYQRKHNLKWTLQYSNRPVYVAKNDKFLVSEYRGQLILQTQVYF